MLDWEGQGLDLRVVWLPSLAVDVDTQDVSRQLSVESCAQSPDCMGMVRLYLELLTVLAVDRLNDPSHSIEQPFDFACYQRHVAQHVTEQFRC